MESKYTIVVDANTGAVNEREFTPEEYAQAAADELLKLESNE